LQDQVFDAAHVGEVVIIERGVAGDAQGVAGGVCGRRRGSCTAPFKQRVGGDDDVVAGAGRDGLRGRTEGDGVRPRAAGNALYAGAEGDGVAAVAGGDGQGVVVSAMKVVRTVLLMVTLLEVGDAEASRSCSPLLPPVMARVSPRPGVAAAIDVVSPM
jgi:hypothetical protein